MVIYPENGFNEINLSSTENKTFKRRWFIMINLTKVRIPKKYENMIMEVDKDSDGYWAYTEKGYYFKGMGRECHTAHEYTQSEFLAMIRTVAPCNCQKCI
jgi:hypothetical protein